MTAQRVIGNKGAIPWDIPEDRQLFRQLTVGGTVIMGRRTYESLSSPLSRRCNLVVTRSGGHYPGAEIVPDLAAALNRAGQIGRPAFVIGGVDLYRAALPLAEYLFVSWVSGEFAGDRYFPEFDAQAWREVAQRQFPGFCHVTYRRA